jgi:glycosyltransferase involved in cell wall biosynthesis
MRIIHTEASKGWGGQEIRILREAEGMRSRGHEVVLAVMKGGELVKRARAANFQVYELRFNRIWWPICLLQLLLIFARHQIELVNTHSSLDSWIGGIAARFARKKIVRTRHLSTPIKKGFNSRFVYGTLADFVVTTCEAIIPLISRQSGKPLPKLRSIPTGVDPFHVDQKEVEEFRKKWNAPILIGTACSMRSWKGIDDLLEAAHLLRENRDLKWVIIGGGHAERHIRKAQELKLEEIVLFTGHLDRPFPAIAALDIFALLSTAHEGVSQAMLQAAFLGKPLISTPVGGLTEVCIDQKTGLLVPPFSPDEVAKAVTKMIQTPHQFGARARELVLEKFTFKKTLDEMENIYHSI